MYLVVESFSLAIWDDLCADFSSTLAHSSHGGLVLASSAGNFAFTNIFVHIARFTTNECLINFNSPI